MVTKHGNWKHPLYRKWSDMKQRCYNTKNKYFFNYGGRGISVSEEWLHNFGEFLSYSLSIGWEHGLEIDRIDNSGNYEPGNIRYVARNTNQRNKRDNVRITIGGENKTAVEWAECSGLSLNNILSRKNILGWSGEKLLSAKQVPRRCIIQKDISGKIIAVHKNASIAGASVGVSNAAILNCCHKKVSCKTAGGFIWEFIQ